MVRNLAVTPDSKPKTALFFLKLGGYLPKWHSFHTKKWIPFTGYFTEISGWVCSVLSSSLKGLYIARKTMSDGIIETEKVMIK